MEHKKLILNAIKNGPFTLKISALIICNVAIIISSYWLIIKPNYQYLQTLRAEEYALKERFVTRQQQAALSHGYKQQLIVMQKQLGALLQQLVSQNELTSLLEELTQSGRKAGLTFELFAPQHAVKHDFYSELPIKISMVGTYMQLMVFIKQTAHMKQLVALQDFTLMREEHNKNDLLVMNAIATIYQ